MHRIMEGKKEERKKERRKEQRKKGRKEKRERKEEGRRGLASWARPAIGDADVAWWPAA